MNAEIGTRKRTRFVSESAYQAASLFSGTVSKFGYFIRFWNTEIFRMIFLTLLFENNRKNLLILKFKLK